MNEPIDTAVASRVLREALHRALPRLLAEFNHDPTSALHGVGDRTFWAWKLIDFANGTHQGAAHGLALLVAHDALPAWLGRDEALARIGTILDGLPRVTRRNGSLEEALPFESSFCVTALVLSDLLAALHVLGPRIDAATRTVWLERLAPLAGFLERHDEVHGIISNHLASAALAAERWHRASGDGSLAARGRAWLERILAHQSDEGWYREYSGPDPGYQSWCTTQLAQLAELTGDPALLASLERSVAFLALAAHPDGSFGGSYGARNTRFLLPGGLFLLADRLPAANALARFAVDSIEHHCCVTLDAIDAHNLVPFCNDYALALAHVARLEAAPPSRLPMHEPGRRWLPRAGWLVDAGPRHYSVVSVASGAIRHCVDGLLVVDSPGMVLRDAAGQLWSTRADEAVAVADPAGDGAIARIDLQARPVRRPQQGPWKFLVLRVLALTLFRHPPLGNLVKRLLAWLLVRGPRRGGRPVTRVIRLGERMTVDDRHPATFTPVKARGLRHFAAIHMASQGYWQAGDDLDPGDRAEPGDGVLPGEERMPVHHREDREDREEHEDRTP